MRHADIGFKSPEHFNIHPYGKVPTLLHKGAVLFETTTTCRYLDACFDGSSLQPSGPIAQAQVDQSCAEIALYIDDALLRGIVLEYAFAKGPNGSVRVEQVEERLPAARSALLRMGELLGDNPFICGQHYSIADALLTPILDYVAKLPIGSELIETGTVNDYLERMRNRPSAQRVLNDA